MARTFRIAVIGLMLCVSAAFAQEAWQGKGKMGGKALDQAGKPVEGVKVKLVNLTVKAGPEFTTTKKGEWKTDNLADGMWYVEYYKDGFDPLRRQVEVGEKFKTQNLEVRLTPEGTDPNLAVFLGAEKVKQLTDAQKFAEARAVYEQLLVKYPKVYQLHKVIAVTYHMEKNFAKAADELQAYVTLVPTDFDAKLYYGKELIAADRLAEAWQVYSTIDPAQIKDFLDLEDPGFDLLRAKHPIEALKYFDLVVTRYPQEPTGFYYRGFAGWHSMLTIAKTDDPARLAYRDKARADIEKFLEMAPAAKEVATAKQILVELKK
jgi:tetratricopeptide (TPR) repeat protein